MIVVLALAVALGLGVDPRRLALLAAATYIPVVLGGLVAVLWLRARPDHTDRPSLFCEGVASELRAGATLRDALTTAATSVGSPPATVGLMSDSPMTEVAAHVAGLFPSISDEIRLTVMAASRSGSDSAALFDEIGSLAIAQSEVRREVRVASAPGRATALLLIGAPLFYVVHQMESGGLARFLASTEQRVVTLIGLGLFLTGLLAASLVLWRASQ